MSLIRFATRDIVSTRLDTANAQFNISSSAVAAASALWAFVAQSSTAGNLYKPDSSSVSTSNVAISAAFRHISNYFFGTSTYVLDSYDKATQRTAIRCIQIGRPLLDEGIYPNTITATIALAGYATGITAYDQVNVSSANSPFGLTGSLIEISTSAANSIKNTVGSVFYDHGVVVLHGGNGVTGSILANSNSGFSISAGTSGPASGQTVLTNFKAQSRNVVKRTIYFCRAFNTDMNFTTNPTARTSDGRIIGGLTANPTTFITTIGLYDDGGNLLAVGKINPPRRKDQFSECLFKVQLDF